MFRHPLSQNLNCRAKVHVTFTVHTYICDLDVSVRLTCRRLCWSTTDSFKKSCTVVIPAKASLASNFPSLAIFFSLQTLSCRDGGKCFLFTVRWHVEGRIRSIKSACSLHKIKRDRSCSYIVHDDLRLWNVLLLLLWSLLLHGSPEKLLHRVGSSEILSSLSYLWTRASVSKPCLDAV